MTMTQKQDVFWLESNCNGILAQATSAKKRLHSASILYSFTISSFLFLFLVPMVDGSVLNLVKVSRLDMGAYMCIASNGVPPAVSKRIHLGIDCEFLYLPR